MRLEMEVPYGEDYRTAAVTLDADPGHRGTRHDPHGEAPAIDDVVSVSIIDPETGEEHEATPLEDAYVRAWLWTREGRRHLEAAAGAEQERRAEDAVEREYDRRERAADEERLRSFECAAYELAERDGLA